MVQGKAPQSNGRSQECQSQGKKGNVTNDKLMKSLPVLEIGQRVRVQHQPSRRWVIKGRILQRQGQRNYFVQTDEGKIMKRNRIHLRPYYDASAEDHEKSSSNAAKDQEADMNLNPEPKPTQRQSGRIRRPPERLTYDHPRR